MWLAKGLEEASRREPGKVRLRPALFFFFFFFFPLDEGGFPRLTGPASVPPFPPRRPQIPALLQQVNPEFATPFAQYMQQHGIDLA